MATSLPLPVRIAAGLLVTGLDRLRRLPQDLPAMSVTMAGQAARLSMRVQQEITELAGRGDELLAGVTSRPTEHPQWARFDDEEDDAAAAGTDTDADAGPGPGARAAADTVAGPDANAGPNAGADASAGVRTPARTGTAARTRTATGPASDPTDPPDMPGYDRLRAAQVRARLHGLDAAAVGRLLDHERAGAARASFVTLLTNRLTTLHAAPPEGTKA